MIKQCRRRNRTVDDIGTKVRVVCVERRVGKAWHVERKDAANDVSFVFDAEVSLLQQRTCVLVCGNGVQRLTGTNRSIGSTMKMRDCSNWQGCVHEEVKHTTAADAIQ